MFPVYNVAFKLAQSYTVGAGGVGGAVLTMDSHGTDQLMVQRMLAARNLRESRLALLKSGVVIFIQFTLFLLIGVGLWYVYGPASTSACPGSPASIYRLSPDSSFPPFIFTPMRLRMSGCTIP